MDFEKGCHTRAGSRPFPLPSPMFGQENRANKANVLPIARMVKRAGDSCLSSIILSPLNGNVKMSPYEQGNICIEPERATTSGGYFQMREGGVGVCQSRRTPVPERAPN